MRKPLPAMIIAFIVGLALGTIVLQFVTLGIELIWGKLPTAWADSRAWYLFGVLLLGALGTWAVRRYIGDNGHAPLAGLGAPPLSPKQYVNVILAILATLFGGFVLGPEVALISTGSLVGYVTAKSMKFDDDASMKKIAGIGSLGGILALFVLPLISGSMSLGTAKDIHYQDLFWAIGVALVVTVIVTLARVLAAIIARYTGPKPHLPIMLLAALVVGGSAMALHWITGDSVLLVVTSGEEFIPELTKLTSISTVILVMLFKSLAYSVSLGGGFRGGPFFPAMFVGGAAGLLTSLIFPSGPSVMAATAVGVIASIIATAKMKWGVAILIGAALGFIFGSWLLIPAGVIGAIVARAVPRWGDRIVTDLDHPAMNTATVPHTGT